MNESKELLAKIRAVLADRLESQASFRDRVVEEYPEDLRNARSARELWGLAEELRINGIYDDTPALRKLLRLVTEHEIEDWLDLESFLTPAADLFNASQYRFHSANESDNEHLGRLADALEEELREATSLREAVR